MFADFERLIVMRVVSSRLEAEFVYDGPDAAPVKAESLLGWCRKRRKLSNQIAVH
jgi:hypothetical protein